MILLSVKAVDSQKLKVIPSYCHHAIWSFEKSCANCSAFRNQLNVPLELYSSWSGGKCASTMREPVSGNYPIHIVTVKKLSRFVRDPLSLKYTACYCWSSSMGSFFVFWGMFQWSYHLSVRVRDHGHAPVYTNRHKMELLQTMHISCIIYYTFDISNVYFEYIVIAFKNIKERTQTNWERC